MRVAGYRQEIDFAKMGPTLVIASSLILAVRTAKWSRTMGQGTSNVEWEAEVEASILMAHRIFSHLASKSPFLFPRKEVPWFEPEEGESPT